MSEGRAHAVPRPSHVRRLPDTEEHQTKMAWMLEGSPSVRREEAWRRSKNEDIDGERRQMNANAGGQRTAASKTQRPPGG